MSTVPPSRLASAPLPPASPRTLRQPTSTLARQEEAFTDEGAPAPARAAPPGPRPETV
jgi:hypothetical protein